MRWSHVISRRVLLTTVLVGITASACKETVTEPIAVASVTVTGGGGTLRLGQSTQLTTTLKSTEGWTLPNVGVSWTSSDAAKATISPSGQVTAVARGPVTLTAAAGGVTGTGAVTVIGVQSIALAPETLSVIVTQTRPMTATTVLDAGVTVTPTWRSLDTTIAKVDTAGRVTAKSTTGLARIEVTAEDKKDTAVVRVIPVPVISVVVTPDTVIRPGQIVQLTVTPKDSIGGTLTNRAVSWSTSDSTKATVSNTGIVKGVAIGTAVITAIVEGKTGASTITVSNTMVGANVPPEIPRNGLVAWLPFDGNAEDYSGNNNHLAVVGATAGQNRFSEQIKSLSFTNNPETATNYLKAEQVSEFKLNQYSVQVWVRNRLFYPSFYEQIYALGPDWWNRGTAFGMSINGQLKTVGTEHWTAVKGYVGASGGQITNGEWYHLVSTYDGSNLKIYVNGILKDSVPTPISFDGQTQFVVGARPDGPSPGKLMGGFNGDLDDMAIWNRALNAEEINKLYSEQKLQSSSLIVDIDAGDTDGCGIARNGKIYCWGAKTSNGAAPTEAAVSYGGFRGDTSRVSSCVAQLGDECKASRIAVGTSHACAITTSRQTVCWRIFGTQMNGQLGTGTTQTDGPVSGGDRFVSVAAGGNTTCALDSQGAAYCWGSNSIGQVGDSTLADRFVPVLVKTSIRFVQLSVGTSHVCGVSTSKLLYCWGDNSIGQLGTSDSFERLVPTKASPDMQIVEVSAGNAMTCTRSQSGLVYCVGSHLYRALGEVVQQSQKAFNQPVSLTRTFSAVASATRETYNCAVSTEGVGNCWGENYSGQFGNGVVDPGQSYIGIVAVNQKIQKIVAGYAVGYALTSDGKIWAWGKNDSGQLGVGVKFEHTGTPRSIFP